jgi:hypothetical protein
MNFILFPREHRFGFVEGFSTAEVESGDLIGYKHFNKKAVRAQIFSRPILRIILFAMIKVN